MRVCRVHGKHDFGRFSVARRRLLAPYNLPHRRSRDGYWFFRLRVHTRRGWNRDKGQTRPLSNTDESNPQSGVRRSRRAGHFCLRFLRFSGLCRPTALRPSVFVLHRSGRFAKVSVRPLAGFFFGKEANRCSRRLHKWDYTETVWCSEGLSPQSRAPAKDSRPLLRFWGFAWVRESLALSE